MAEPIEDGTLEMTFTQDFGPLAAGRPAAAAACRPRTRCTDTTRLGALQTDGQYSEALSEAQVSGAGPVLEKISIKVS
ncbi:hypothetical protein [Streptomyces sp. BRA346]|uniref:hypothetical protein n=1 Tax=Streptomyces sp. BRA346 TaxID=2878199 RepID=UPI0040649D9B